MTHERPPIFLNSLPKSGTNLVSRLFDIAGFSYGELGIAATLLLGDKYPVRQALRRSFFEKSPLIIGLDVQVPVRRAWMRRRLQQAASSDYITGHANHSTGLETLLDDFGFRTVQVIRDPRDVVLSWAHYVAGERSHFLHGAFRDAGLSERIDHVLSGGHHCGLDVAPFSMVLDRVDRWLGRPNVLTVRFEDLIGSQGSGSDARQSQAFDELAEFTGRDFPREKLKEELYGNSKTFRKGRIGGARTELDKGDLTKIEDRLALYLEKWNYA